MSRINFPLHFIQKKIARVWKVFNSFWISVCVCDSGGEGTLFLPVLYLYTYGNNSFYFFLLRFESIQKFFWMWYKSHIWLVAALPIPTGSPVLGTHLDQSPSISGSPWSAIIMSKTTSSAIFHSVSLQVVMILLPKHCSTHQSPSHLWLLLNHWSPGKARAVWTAAASGAVCVLAMLC